MTTNGSTTETRGGARTIAARIPDWVDGLLAACVSVVIGLTAFTTWPIDLRLPFVSVGDGTSAQYNFKSILEHGTYARNPDVGAPFGATMYDYPIPEPTHHLMIRVMGWFTRDPFLAFNLFYLFSFATAAFAAHWAFRRNGIDRLTAIAGAIAFAILPYHFYRLGHIFLASYFAVPILACYALQLASYKGSHLKDVPRLRIGTAIVLALAAGSGVYYAFFGVLFLALGAGLGAARSRSLSVVRPAAGYVAIVVATVAAGLLPNFLYHLAEGSNRLVAARNPGEAEMYGLRITQLLLPAPGHRLAPFDAFVTAYRHYAPLMNENMTAVLGLMGSAGFIFALLAFFSGDIKRYPLTSAMGAMCVAAVLYGSIGGFGSLAAMVAIPEIRGLNRISLFIAFFSLLTFFIVARHALRATNRPARRAGFALAVLIVACLDQIPVKALVKPNAVTVQNQRAFFARVQTAFPAGTAFFEFPYDFFPESGRPPGSYYLFDPYLFTDGFRWSFGDMRGRPSDLWNEQASKLTGQPLADALGRAGFGAIYVDRRGYPADHGVGIETMLRAQFGPPILEDTATAHAVYRVQPPAATAAPFLVVSPEPDWFPWAAGAKPGDEAAWSSGSANLTVANPSAEAVALAVDFSLSTLEPRRVTMSYGGSILGVYDLEPGKTTKVHTTLLAQPGASRLALATDISAHRISAADARRVAFRLESLAYGPVRKQ